MYSNPFDPLGVAITDYQSGKKSAKISVFSDFEIPSELTVDRFFREPDEFPPIESTALSLCKGRVLDIGAGAGCHVLALQEMGHDTVGMDISDAIVNVMVERGVKHSICADIFNLSADQIDDLGRFDTILMMMNGIGVAGDIIKLSQFLGITKALLNPGGRMIFDSVDLRETCTDAEIRARELASERSYFGEVTYQFMYRGNKGPEFNWLFIDPDLLHQIADENGWVVAAIHTMDNGRYVAHLEVAD